MQLPRRRWLKVGALAVLASPLPWLFRRTPIRRAGTLVPDEAGLLDLPRGFTYRVLQRAGQLMTDGHRVPGLPDGMACFAAGEQLILMRNHELDRSAQHRFYSGHVPVQAYDREAFGGVSRLVLNHATLEPLSSNLVLAGTLRNCSGGPSPWGFLSCEESVEEDHGYVFRCRVEAAELERAQRLVSYGRFNHEAVCIEPGTARAYLTEDRVDGCLYRFVPLDAGEPWGAGHLQALVVAEAPGFDTSRNAQLGAKLRVTWVTLPDPDPRQDTLRYQAAERGAARICRGEGMTYHEGSIFICATAGGPVNAGQIFRLTLAAGRDSNTALELVAQADALSLDMPDNVWAAPWGDLILAEDGAGDQYLRGLTPEGRVYDIGRNARSSSEFAGVCMDPTGRVLFVNMQHDGLTLAITGPFATLGRS